MVYLSIKPRNENLTDQSHTSICLYANNIYKILNNDNKSKDTRNLYNKRTR